MNTTTRIFSMVAVLATAVAATNAYADTLFYMEGFGTNLYRYDTVTTSETFIGNTGVSNGFSLAFSPSGTLYLHTTIGDLYTLNTSNAAAALVGNTGINVFPESLTFDLTGRLLASAGQGLYEINPINATSTFLGNISGSFEPDDITVAPIAMNVQGLGVVPAGTYFAVDSHSLFTINPNTLVSTFVGQTVGDEALAFGPTGILYTHNDNGGLYTISLNPLSDVFLAATTPGLVFAVSVQRVPEPAAFAMLAVCAVGFVWNRWRR